MNHRPFKLSYLYLGVLTAAVTTWFPIPAQADQEMALPGAGTIPFEAEALASRAIASEGDFRSQEMAPFGSGWSGGAQLFWTPKEPGALLRLELDVDRAGLYEIVLSHTTAPDYGLVAVRIDETEASGFDGYAPGVARAVLELGTRRLEAGTHTMTFIVTGSAEPSSGYFVGLDRIELRPALPGATGTTPPDVVPPSAWTAQDVIDPRIDVAAQRVLISGLSSDAARREVSAGLVGAVKSGELGGIYQEDQAVPARLAQARGIGWWQLIPEGRDSVLIAPAAATEAPVAAFRRALAQSSEQLANALASLWVELGARSGSKDPRCAGPIPGPGCDSSCDGWRRDNESMSTKSAEDHLRIALGFTTIPAVASVSCVAAPGYFSANGRLCTVRYQASALEVEIGLPDPPSGSYCGCQCVFARQIAPTAHSNFDIYGCYCSPKHGLRLVPTGGVQPNPYARP